MTEPTKDQLALALSEELLSDLENHRLQAEAVVYKAARLARVTGDDRFLRFMHREVHGYLHKSSEQDEDLGNASRIFKDRTWYHSYGVCVSILARNREELAAIPTQQWNEDQPIKWRRDMLRETTHQLEVATQKVRSLIYSFALNTFARLKFSSISHDIFSLYKRGVDERLAESCEEVLAKLPTAFDRLAAGQRNEEAISHALTTCRRMLDAFADSIYPAVATPIQVGSETFEIGADKPHNRLIVYVLQGVASESRRIRLKQSIKSLYGSVNKGVHADVTHEEARALVLQTYLLLGEIITLSTPAPAVPTSASEGEPAKEGDSTA